MEVDERPAQILALDGRLREARCNSVSDIADFIFTVGGTWMELGSLGDPRSHHVKRAASIIGIRDALPHHFTQLTLRLGIDYIELKRCLTFSNAYSEGGAGSSEESMIPQTQARESARAGAKLGAEQCAYYLKKNHH